MARPHVRRLFAASIAVGAVTAGTLLASGATASAAPTYIGPVYYEVTQSIFSTACADAAAAQRAAGATVLVECAPWFGPQRGLSYTPYQLTVGVAPNAGS